MCKNHGVSYIGAGKVEVSEIDYPELALGNRRCDQGVIFWAKKTNAGKMKWPEHFSLKTIS